MKMKKVPTKQQNDKALTTLSAVANSNSAVDYVRTLHALKKNADIWDGMTAVPPRSVLEKVVNHFRRTTDIPFHIPFYQTLHFISAMLLSRGVRIEFAGQVIKPDFWSVILAPSSSGKTFSQGFVAKLFEDVRIPMMPQTKSAAAFVESLAENNDGLWIRDEFGQFMKELENASGPQAPMKEILLNLYGNDPISWNTKKSRLTIEDPALSIVGMTVPETFLDQISTESIVDGFGQCFAYIRVTEDPNRKMEDFTIYTTHCRNHEPILKEMAKVIAKIDDGDVYRLSKSGRDAFEETFRAFAKDTKVPPSFFRRAMFRAVKYALVYHVILKKKTKVIDATDVTWGTRLAALNLRDAAWLLENHGVSIIEKWCRRAEEIRDKCSRESKPFNVRAILRGIDAITNAGQAHALMRLIGEE